jgi:hypothetical protein
MLSKEVLIRFTRMGVKRTLQIARPAFEELNLIRLSDALLCANCEVIVNEPFNGGCPSCSSHALMRVSHALGGTLEEPRTKPPMPELPGFYSSGWEN